jgi:pilus assembly protein Flp/PilA
MTPTVAATTHIVSIAIIRRYLEMADLIIRALNVLDRDEEGQGLAEYALILALIAIVVIGAVIFLGGQINTIMSNIGRSI